MSGVFQLSVVTPDGAVYDGHVRSLRLPGVDGSLGILPRHAPMIAVLQCGIAHVVHEDGEAEQIAAGEGYAEVRPGNVGLIISFLNGRPDVDEERAHGAMKRAMKRLEEREDGVDMARAEAALCRAIARLKVCGCGCHMCRCH
jgi:F-type H+-transporting ATPase subunit epsilon